MIEWLVAWGSSQAVKFIAQEVVGKLGKGAAEDYVKDFLKQNISNAVARIANGEPLKKATKQAIKDFQNLGYKELKNTEVNLNVFSKLITIVLLQCFWYFLTKSHLFLSIIRKKTGIYIH